MSAATATAAVHVEEAGDHGPLLLCLHGIGSSSAAFAPQLGELSAYVRVVAWDAPGYAKSPDPAGPMGLDDYADAAAALIRERATTAHVLGVSWGGVIALRLATRHPELVASLIIADSSPGSGTDEAKAASMRARSADLAELGPRAFAEARGPRLVSPDAPDELVRRVVDTMADSVRLPGYAYAAESMASADLRAELPSIAAPALVLCGEQDRVTGVEASQAVAGAIHRTAYVIVKDAGHLANQEQPGHFDAWVLSHLRITAAIPE
ncbi:alpha/beta fold hydrolase [Streptomyces sp. NE06-03E]|uniref:alpha/beta fold hydrolase n=1 Tax=unclassified Streptomyces TaxID=2593676 RepID=UPI000F558532|nr:MULTISPECIES: alpha/beta fold hydrolase [unclassified Streptomyces]WSS60111.1 alpha/beta hydrolase [Streptomyces sp. NBC_01177]WSS67215.1 alpha/beta hydrolase [Streptomyces sp. NBC_01175]WSS74131.1 alpha/beta hydrolase [Streptomyces sp. NBC_01174]MDX3054543.1 alpha/beta fold hydrolase [Streptomyces sp. NE06-03E]MDX3684713.1 alpha/beta fold hydrolase [Streptomyces sp. AK04-4c]